MRISDLNFEYDSDISPRPNLISYGVDTSKNRILHCLSTTLGSVPFNRTYGSNMQYLIHEPISPEVASLLENSIYQTIETQIPRVKVTYSGIIVSPLRSVNQEGYRITVEFVDSIDGTSDILQFSALR